MAYIYVKKKDNKEYYYLRESYRKKGKNLTKDIMYLGNEKSGIDKEKLKEYKGKIKNLQLKLNLINQIKDSKNKNSFFNKNQFVKINFILENYKQSRQTKNLKEFIPKFIKENNSLDITENRYPSLKEVNNIIEKRISQKRIPLIQAYKITNTKNILDYLEKTKPVLNLKMLEEIHEMLYKDVYPTTGLRNKNITPKNYYKTISVNKIKIELRKLFSWYNKNKTRIHPLILVTLFHHKFEKIHPFFFGNGEIGRVLINYQLVELKYPPIIIHASKKKEYFEEMKKADKAIETNLLSTDMKYYKPLIDFMQKQFVKTYWDIFVD